MPDVWLGGLMSMERFSKKFPGSGPASTLGQEQLVNEVKGIYVGLVMVEKKK
jgi:hypothetical protein